MPRLRQLECTLGRGGSSKLVNSQLEHLYAAF